MPCTTAKLEANRQNARNSTGPRTPEGKARSSRNALKHGFCASGSALTPLEDRDAYESFTASIIHSLRPATAIEQDLAHRIADLSWRLRRIPDAEAALLTRDTVADLAHRCRPRDEQNDNDQEAGQDEEEHDHHDDHDDQNEDVTPASPARHLAAAMGVPQNPYLTLQRYEQSLDRARSRALKELRQLQKDRRQNPEQHDEAPRRNEPTTPPPCGEPHGEPQKSEISTLRAGLPQGTGDHGPATAAGLLNEPKTLHPQSQIQNENPQVAPAPRLFHLKRSELRPHPAPSRPAHASIAPPEPSHASAVTPPDDLRANPAHPPPVPVV